MGRVMAARKGTRLADGETWSAKYPGYIDKGNGSYRQPFLYRGKQLNRYFVEKVCDCCGVEHLQYTANAKRAKAAYCSAGCAVKGKHKPDGAVRYKRGKSAGHVLEKSIDHPFAKKGWVPQHRLVVERQIGRLLAPEEIVHHINCVANDNRPENLVVCDSVTAHNLAHASLLACVRPLLDSGVLGFDVSTLRYFIRGAA